MVDRDEGDIQSRRHTLGKVQSHHQAAQQPGTAGHRNRVDLANAQGRLGDGCLDHLLDPLGVEAAGEFGHHALIRLMQLDLCGDHIAENLMSIADNSRTALVTACLNTQYVHSSSSSWPIASSRNDSILTNWSPAKGMVTIWYKSESPSPCSSASG